MATSAASLTNDQAFERMSPTREALRRLLKHRSAQVGMIILGLMILIAIFAPLIAPYDPYARQLDTKRRAAPCIHALGCPADQSEHIDGH